MVETKGWARRLGISTAGVPPSIAATRRFSKWSARDVATRAVILQGVVATACEVDPRPIVRWFKRERLWASVTTAERAFLLGKSSPSLQRRLELRWHQEAEWTLLWALGAIEALGLPTQACDTRRLVDELIPPLGADLEPYLKGAKLRPAGELQAEDNRTYDLYCAGVAAHRAKRPLPRDLVWGVLVERRRAFEWLGADDSWDDVTCDA